MDNKKINVVRKTLIQRKKISLLNDEKDRMRLEEKVIELVDVGVQNLWVHSKNEILRECYDVCGKKRGKRKSKGDTWYWNDDMEAITRKKDAHKATN